LRWRPSRYGFTPIAERLDAAFPNVADSREVIATGGGLSSSPTWTGIVADALLALEALVGPGTEEDAAPFGETYEPDLSRHAIYREALERQRELYDAVMRK
jgi:sugar (pentulose or hexulose) kinase